jgi:hypothetical protein
MAQFRYKKKLRKKKLKPTTWPGCVYSNKVGTPERKASKKRPFIYVQTICTYLLSHVTYVYAFL